ncbi:MAG TPA: phosphoenolpyruvate carboxylase, partial [Lacipirellulaceae bacterium]|nr:phosphoenolpyruvate carboxylase [Lacipirellulaceae bacterium]
MSDPKYADLRREVDHLGRRFGEVVEQLAGAEAFALVETVRTLARQFTEGSDDAGAQLRALLAGLDGRQLAPVIRAFSIFLELANLAEDRQRIRVLQQRERDLHPQPRRESIRDAIAAFHSRNLPPGEVQALVGRAQIELVLTAHPTEAKRRSVRRILRRIHALLVAGDAADATPSSQQRAEATLSSELELLWQTDLLRPFRPTPLQEVERGLAFHGVLWDEVPEVVDDLRQALAEYYPGLQSPHEPLVRYGSWIGGDRDGNPFVTPEITRQTLQMERSATLEKHLHAARMLARTLSISERHTPSPASLREAVAEAGRRWPELGTELERIAPLETLRHWLYVVQWRLRQTDRVTLDDAQATPPAGAYAGPDELHADVQRVADALLATGNRTTFEVEVQPWLDQIRVFGFHTARLDVRQHSGVYVETFDELWRARGVLAPDETCDEARREALLTDTLDEAPNCDVDGLGPQAAETFEMFRVLRRTARRSGMDVLGAHVISMT